MRAVRFLIFLAVVPAVLPACADEAARAPEPTGPEEGYVTVGEVELYYRTTGAAADTIVVLHGGPGLHAEYLAPDLEPLAEDYTLIFYDQRGAGARHSSRSRPRCASTRTSRTWKRSAGTSASSA